MKQIPVISIFWGLLFPCLLAGQTLYEDARFKRWKSYYEEGNYEMLISVLQADLLKEDFHPLAPDLWIVVHEKKEGNENILAQAPTNLKKKLVLATDARNLEGYELLRRYSIAEIQNTGGLTAKLNYIQASIHVSPSNSLALTRHVIKQYGTPFLVLASITEGVKKSSIYRQFLQREIQTGAFDQYPVAKKYLTVLFEHSMITRTILLKSIGQYLETYANDPVALYHQGQLLAEINRFREAVQYLKSSYTSDPFFLGGEAVVKQAACHLQLNQNEEAQKNITVLAAGYAATQRTKAEKLALARAYLQASLRKQARELLWEINPQYPSDPFIQYQLGMVEFKSGRFDIAASHFAKAIKLDPSVVDYYLNVCEASRKAEDFQQIVALVEDFSNRTRYLPERLYVEKINALLQLEAFAKAESVLNEATRLYPYSGILLQQEALAYSLKDDYNQAINLLEQSFQYTVPDEAMLEKYYQVSVKLFGGDELQIGEQLRALVNQFPEQEYLWFLMTQLKNSTAQKWAIWEEAAKANPQKSFPYRRIRDLFIKDGQWDKALKIMDIAINDLSKGAPPGEQAKVYLNRAEICLLRYQKEQMDDPTFSQTIADLEQYLALSGAAHTYHFNLAKLNFIFHNPSKGIEQLGLALKMAPDQQEYLLWAQEHLSDPTALFPILHNWWMRDPYEPDRARRFVAFHLYKGGSSIVALSVMYRYGYEWPDLKNLAYDKLGDQDGYYLENYAKATAIPPNTHSIQQYHTARQKSWNGKVDVTIDFNNFQAQIILENGTKILREDDPMTGKPKQLRFVNQEISFFYGITGLLKKVQEAKGRQIEFFYDERGLITQIDQSDEKMIQLTYDQSGRPVRIQKGKEVALQVKYDAYGKIISVQSNDNGNALLQFQQIEQLLAIPKVVSDLQSYLLKGELPVIFPADPKLLELQNAYQQMLDHNLSSSETLPLIETGLAYIHYILTKGEQGGAFSQQALQIAGDLFTRINAGTSTQMIGKGAALIDKYYELCRIAYPEGLALANWTTWVEMQDWLQQATMATGYPKNLKKEIESTFQKVTSNPLYINPDEKLMAGPEIQNPSFWQNLYFQGFSGGTTIQAVQMLEEDQVLVGTNKGLYIYQYGYWQLAEFDPSEKSLIQTFDAPKADDYNDIKAITTDAAGNIYLGTSEGVIALNSEIYGSVRTIIDESAGLFSNAITSLAYQKGTLYIGTAKGLIKNNADGSLESIALPSVNNLSKITFLKACSFSQNNRPVNEQLLVGTAKGLFVIEQGTVKPVDEEVDDAVVDSKGRLFLLKDQKVFRAFPQKEKYRFFELSTEYLSGGVKKINGLSLFPYEDGVNGLSLLTNQGLVVYRYNYFNPIKIAGASGPGADLQYCYPFGKKVILGGKEDLQGYRLRQPTIHTGKVLDLVTINALKMTFVADGRNLKYLQHDDPLYALKPIVEAYAGNINALAVYGEDQLLFNNGPAIYSATYDPTADRFTTKALFSLKQFETGQRSGKTENQVQNILAAKDGRIWVCTSTTLYHYDNGQVSDFNYLKDPVVFPARSNSLYRVFETIDHQIRVVCADETPAAYNGEPLTGGLLEWKPQMKRFVRLETRNDQRSASWFVSAYTPIGEGQAILSTAEGFQYERYGVLHSFSSPGHSSYLGLRKAHPSLFLGTKGVAYGKLRLFGCAAGVVIYDGESWSYPEILNGLLPDDSSLGEYGSRHVNTLEADEYGKIYVGTDRGLLVYPPPGKNAIAWLATEFGGAKAFQWYNRQLVKQNQEKLLQPFYKKPQSRQLLDQIAATESRQKNILQQIAKWTFANVTGKIDQLDSLNGVLTINNTKLDALLLDLKNKYPHAHLFLTGSSINLKALQQQLGKEEILIQYALMEEQLIAFCISNRSAAVFYRNVNQRELRQLFSDAKRLPKSEVKGNVLAKKGGAEEYTNPWIGLYDVFVRPLEPHLLPYKKAYVLMDPNESVFSMASLIQVTQKSKAIEVPKQLNFQMIQLKDLYQPVSEWRQQKDPR